MFVLKDFAQRYFVAQICATKRGRTRSFEPLVRTIELSQKTSLPILRETVKTEARYRRNSKLEKPENRLQGPHTYANIIMKVYECFKLFTFRNTRGDAIREYSYT